MLAAHRGRTQQTAIVDRLVHHLSPARQAAEQIVILDRSAAAAAAGGYLLSRDKTLAAVYLRDYDQVVQHLRNVLIQANTLSDTQKQRQDIQQFTRFYFGSGGYYHYCSLFGTCLYTANE